MKSLMGAPSSNTKEIQGLANKCTEGDMTQLVNYMNDFFVSVSADLKGSTRHTAFSTSRNHCQQNSRLKQPLHKGRYRKGNVGKQPDRTTFLRVYSTVRKDYTPLHVYVGCIWVVIYVKYITHEGLLHNTLALDVDTVQERCILWAQSVDRPIHGSRCAIYRDPYFAQESMDRAR